MDENKRTIAVFDELANQYQQKYMSVESYSDTLDLFCDAIKKQKAKVLELGCGPGNITRYLLNKRPGFQVLATDLAPRMLALAQQNNPSATTCLMDCRDIGQLEEAYDAIIGGFCLPYLSKEECKKLISNAAQQLNPMGLIYLSTIEGDYSKSELIGPSSGGTERIFTYYHEAVYLQDFLKENGFSILKVKRQSCDNNKEEANKDLIIIAKLLAHGVFC